MAVAINKSISYPPEFEAEILKKLVFNSSKITKGSKYCRKLIGNNEPNYDPQILEKRQ